MSDIGSVETNAGLLWNCKHPECIKPKKKVTCCSKCSLCLPRQIQMVEKTEHPIAVMLINCTEEKQVSMTACVCDVCFFCAFRSLGHVMQLCFLRAPNSSTVQLVTPLQWVMVCLTGASVTTCRRSQRTEQSLSNWGVLSVARGINTVTSVFFLNFTLSIVAFVSWTTWL